MNDVADRVLEVDEAGIFKSGVANLCSLSMEINLKILPYMKGLLCKNSQSKYSVFQNFEIYFSMYKVFLKSENPLFCEFSL